MNWNIRTLHEFFEEHLINASDPTSNSFRKWRDSFLDRKYKGANAIVEYLLKVDRYKYFGKSDNLIKTLHNKLLVIKCLDEKNKRYLSGLIYRDMLERAKRSLQEDQDILNRIIRYMSYMYCKFTRENILQREYKQKSTHE